MRIAIVDVRSAALRSIVGEATGEGPRRVMDRTVAIGLSPMLRGPVAAPAVSGTVDILRETARRFHDAHRRLGVERAVLTMDGELRGPLHASGVAMDLAQLLGAEVADDDVDREARDLVRAAVDHRVLDDQGSLVVELGSGVARVAAVEGRQVRAAARIPAPAPADLAAVVRPGGDDGWLDVAVAAALPLLDAVPALGHAGPARIVASGAPVQALARAVAGRERRRPLRPTDRTRITAPVVLAMTSDLRAARPGQASGGLDPDEIEDAAGTAVLLAGLLAVTGAPAVVTTEAERVEGRLLDLLDAAGPTVAPPQLVDAGGDR